MEMGRVEWLRQMGISYKSMEEKGTMLPVISLSIDYKKSAVYDDLITVETRLKRTPSVKIEFDYTITNEKGEILALGNTVLAFVNSTTKRPIKCPKFLLDKLAN